MTPPLADQILAAEVVLPCEELDEMLAFFTQRLGFRIDSIQPADDPAIAIVVGHGLRIRMERGRAGPPGALRLSCRGLDQAHRELIAPNGTRIELANETSPLVLPPLEPSFVLSRLDSGTVWKRGRAGMHYRDLIPDRQGGRFVASHIRIAEGGNVPDYVHHHDVRFQMIFCTAGWVRVVYADQGPPFVMHPGDAVLQPPNIRHRVLECASGTEVVELACPAAHPTRADPELALPTPELRPDRDFSGQRFVRHQASAAVWGVWRCDGFEARDLGIAAATRSLADAVVARRSTSLGAAHGARANMDPTFDHEGQLRFIFVIAGSATLSSDRRAHEPLAAGDALVIPPGEHCALSSYSDKLEIFEVTISA